MNLKQLIELINQSEMVLVGIGSEMSLPFSQIEHKNLSLLEETILDKETIERETIEQETIEQALHNLFEMIKDKNYYIISTNMDDEIRKYEFDQDRVVTPCGGFTYLQCKNNCNKKLFLANDGEKHCPDCGEELIFCNKMAENYNEEIYLQDWENYTKWMQGTLNRKLLMIELGVGFQYPTVIRWPFEKMAFINQKATLVRVHSKLYQLTEELKERAYSVNKNPVLFLHNK